MSSVTSVQITRFLRPSAKCSGSTPHKANPLDTTERWKPSDLWRFRSRIINQKWVVPQYDKTRKSSRSFLALLRRNVDKKEQCLCLITHCTFPSCQHTPSTETHINKSLCCRDGCMSTHSRVQNWIYYAYKTFIVCIHIFQRVCHGNLFSSLSLRRLNRR